MSIQDNTQGFAGCAGWALLNDPTNARLVAFFAGESKALAEHVASILVTVDGTTRPVAPDPIVVPAYLTEDGGVIAGNHLDEAEVIAELAGRFELLAPAWTGDFEDGEGDLAMHIAPPTEEGR